MSNETNQVLKEELDIYYDEKKIPKLKLSDRGRGVCLLLRLQVQHKHEKLHGNRGMSPEIGLHLAVVEQCIRDVCAGPRASVSLRDRSTGRRYLRGSMPHAQVCGLNPEWVRSKMRVAGIEIGSR